MFRNPRKYVIELDNVTYACLGDRLEQVLDSKDVSGDKWLVSDFDEAISRTMTVEAPARYAEVMVRKKLQEGGDIDEAVSIICHWKKQKTKTTTDIFFTAVPVRLYHRRFQQIKDDQDSVLLFPLCSVLHSVVKRASRGKPVAVVFHHGRFSDMVIGVGKRVLYANRCVAFDTSHEQLSALWDMVWTDIKTVETEERIRVDRILILNWIDSGPDPDLPDDVKEKCVFWDRESVSFNGQDHAVSLLKAVRRQPGIKALSPPLEKACYYARRSLVYLNGIFFLAVLLCVAAYFWHCQRNDMLRENLTALKAKIAGIEQTAPPEEVLYKDTLSFVRGLSEYRKAPSYRSVLNDISEALSDALYLQVLKVDYAGNDMKIEVFGRTQSSFDSAYEAYQGFLEELTARGYITTESRFDTKIQQSEFLVKFTKNIQ